MLGAVKKYVLIAGGVIFVILVGGIIVAAIFGVLLQVLYIFLMVLAAFLVVATFMQIFSIVVLIQTIVALREEMKPLLASVQETVGIVKDTAKTAGHTASTIGSAARLTNEFALGPSVRIAAGVVAGQQVLRVLLGRGHVGNRVDQRRRQQMEAMSADGMVAANGMEAAAMNSATGGE
jgi:hypothetical protein